MNRDPEALGSQPLLPGNQGSQVRCPSHEFTSLLSLDTKEVRCLSQFLFHRDIFVSVVFFVVVLLPSQSWGVVLLSVWFFFSLPSVLSLIVAGWDHRVPVLQTEGLPRWECVSPSSGGWKSETEMWTGLFLPRPLSWACELCLLPVSSHGRPSTSFAISRSCKDTSPILDWDPHWWPRFNVTTLWIDPASKHGHTLRCWGVRILT